MDWLTPLAARHAFLGNCWESITDPVGQSGVRPGWRLRTQRGGGVRVGLALAHLANCKASPCNFAERLGSGSSRACLLEPWTPREDFQPGYSRGSPRCKSRSELSHFAYLFYFFSSLNISQLLPNSCAAKTARERFHRGQIKRRWVMRVF